MHKSREKANVKDRERNYDKSRSGARINSSKSRGHDETNGVSKNVLISIVVMLVLDSSPVPWPKLISRGLSIAIAKLTL